MNYYPHHTGDYARDTGHLTLIEHGALRLLLDRYYATEDGIPADQVHRLARARSKEERAAVDAVLAEFFVLDSGRWRNKRCDMEIAKYRESEPDRAAKRENEKERQRRSRERRKAIFDTLREHGVVPAYETSMSELQTILSRVTNTPVTQPVTRDATATQTHTHTQYKNGIPESRSNSPESPPAVAGHSPPKSQIAPDFAPDQANRATALSLKLDLESETARFVAHFSATGDWRANWQAQFRKWLLDSMQHAADRAKRQTGTNGSGGGLPWWSTDQSILAKGRELSLDPRPGESMAQFKGRVSEAIAHPEGHP